MRTFVITKVPRFPCSADRFQTPLYLENTCSFGSIISYFSWMMAHLSFKSLYNLVVSYERITAWNDVKSLGLFFTKDVKINSYLLCWNLVLRYKDNWLPLITEFVSLISVLRMQSKPTERFTREFISLNQIRRRFVISKLPLSPLLPLVSSTWGIVSMTFSPGRHSKSNSAESKRISRSCQINSAVTD